MDWESIRARLREEEEVENRASHDVYFQRAALRNAFTFSEIGISEASDEERQVIDPLIDACQSFLTSDAQEIHWRLNPNTRVEILKNLAQQPNDLEARLSEISDEEAGSFKNLVFRYFKHEQLPIEEQDFGSLSASMQIANWFGDAGLDFPHTKEALRAQRDRLEFLAPFQALTEHFRGRERELDQLREYVEWLPSRNVAQSLGRSIRRLILHEERPPLMLYGLGGAGKTTLVAKFILDHIVQDRPIPFIYLDFDKPGVSIQEPITILLEGLRQLKFQFPDHSEHTQEYLNTWQRQLSQTRQRVLLRSSADLDERAVEQTYASSSFERGSYLDQFDDVWTRIQGDRDLPLLVVLDSFEEFQNRSQAHTSLLFDFLRQWAQRVPRLRAVLSGRSTLRPSDDQETQDVYVGDFDSRAAVGFLDAMGVKDHSLAMSIVNKFGGNPLTLQLASGVVQKQQEETQKSLSDIRTHELLFLRIEDSQVQEQLFRRNLAHIHDENARNLAFPGLVVRRLSAGVIQNVLAQPCGLGEINEEEAEQIFEAMKNETFLVIADEDGEFRYRPDLRRLMLDLVHREEPQKARDIHDAAVRHYQEYDENYARAEEIYHRLVRGDDPTLVAERFHGDALDDILPFLEGALQELPVNAHIFLADRLGFSVPESVREQASLEGWEISIAYELEEILNSGDEGILNNGRSLIEERPERMPNSPLYKLEIELFERLGENGQALDIADIALADARKQLDVSSEMQLLLLKGRILERMGRWAAARSVYAQAFNRSGSLSLRIKAQVSLGRLRYRDGDRRIIDLSKTLKIQDGILGQEELEEIITKLREELPSEVMHLFAKDVWKFEVPWMEKNSFERLKDILRDKVTNVSELEKMVEANMKVFLREIISPGVFEVSLHDVLHYAEREDKLSMLFSEAELEMVTGSNNPEELGA